MSYQITWKDFNNKEHETPVFVIGGEKESLEFLAIHSIHKKQVKEIINIKPIIKGGINDKYHRQV